VIDTPKLNKHNDTKLQGLGC